MSEVWRQYKKIPNRFEISNMGRVRSIKGKKILKTALDKYGYQRMAVIVGSRTDGTRRTINLKVHQMVAETFMVRPDGKGFTVNHKDTNKLNNSINNLEWVTFSDNTKHAWKMGIYKNLFTGRRHTVETKKKLSMIKKEWHARRRLGV